MKLTKSKSLQQGWLDLVNKHEGLSLLAAEQYLREL